MGFHYRRRRQPGFGLSQARGAAAAAACHTARRGPPPTAHEPAPPTDATCPPNEMEEEEEGVACFLQRSGRGLTALDILNIQWTTGRLVDYVLTLAGLAATTMHSSSEDSTGALLDAIHGLLASSARQGGCGPLAELSMHSSALTARGVASLFASALETEARRVLEAPCRPDGCGLQGKDVVDALQAIRPLAAGEGGVGHDLERHVHEYVVAIKAFPQLDSLVSRAVADHAPSPDAGEAEESEKEPGREQKQKQDRGRLAVLLDDVSVRQYLKNLYLQFAFALSRAVVLCQLCQGDAAAPPPRAAPGAGPDAHMLCLEDGMRSLKGDDSSVVTWLSTVSPPRPPPSVPPGVEWLRAALGALLGMSSEQIAAVLLGRSFAGRP